MKTKTGNIRLGAGQVAVLDGRRLAGEGQLVVSLKRPVEVYESGEWTDPADVAEAERLQAAVDAGRKTQAALSATPRLATAVAQLAKPMPIIQLDKAAVKG